MKLHIAVLKYNLIKRNRNFFLAVHMCFTKIFLVYLCIQKCLIRQYYYLNSRYYMHSLCNHNCSR